MQIAVAYIWIIEIFFNNIIEIILRHLFCFHVKMKARPWRHIYHDIEMPRPKNHDIDIPRPKSCDIEISRPKNHDIEIRGLKHHDIQKLRQSTHDIAIPRHFFG